eukprot:scaffold128745_cov75-Phaeocystis_antarctica.AAC.1
MYGFTVKPYARAVECGFYTTIGCELPTLNWQHVVRLASSGEFMSFPNNRERALSKTGRKHENTDKATVKPYGFISTIWSASPCPNTVGVLTRTLSLALRLRKARAGATRSRRPRPPRRATPSTPRALLPLRARSASRRARTRAWAT